MNTNYSSLVWDAFQNNKDAFREYILQKDTIIISDSWDEWLTCSEGVSEKLHNDMKLLEKVKDSLFYKDGETIYFIFSRYYKGIWEVRIFFDTTEYIKSQIIIIKVSIALIILWFFIYLFWGKIISRFTLKNLKYISKKAQSIDLDKKYTPLKIDGSDEDEIKILANTLNTAFWKIEKQTESLKQFITDVSHEFKTPLMIINSDIDLYEKKKEKWKLEADADAVFLKNVRTKTAKLNKLIETLFLLTRMEENIAKIQFSNRDIWKVLERLVSEQVKNHTEKKIELDFDIKKWIFKNIEETSFNIIIENLISNAIKFSTEPIKISVKLGKNGFSIRDNGKGMTPDEQEKVLEKFYRLDTNIEGFGIGLYLVQRMVKLYKWQIKIESKKWEYTEFHILFNTSE